LFLAFLLLAVSTPVTMMRPILARCAARCAPRCAPFGATARPVSRVLLGTSTWRPTRQYSIKAEAAESSKPQGLDASKLTIEKTTKPKPLKNAEELVFGQTFTGPLPLHRPGHDSR